jgi:hypothetical protein
MPSEAKKTTRDASGALLGACSGAAKAPAGEISRENTISIENKRSRGKRIRPLLRFTVMELSIIILLWVN